MLYMIEAPRQWQVEAVGRNLRTADAKEAMAVTGKQPVAAVLQSWGMSKESFAILCDRVPVGLGGIVPFGTRTIVWMCGTPLMTAPSNLREFVTESRHVFKRLASRYGMLENAVSLENTLHVRWLQWVGCEFHETFTINQTAFRRFSYV